MRVEPVAEGRAPSPSAWKCLTDGACEVAFGDAVDPGATGSWWGAPGDGVVMAWILGRRRAATVAEISGARYALGADFAGQGPALIVEYGSSTMIGPRDTFQIGNLGEIRIDCHH